MKKAGFWRRFGAVFIDSIITSPTVLIFHWGPGVNTTESSFVSLIGIIYETILISQWGGYTIGKKIMGIRVVTITRKQLDWVKAFVRAVSKVLSAIVFLV